MVRVPKPTTATLSPVRPSVRFSITSILSVCNSYLVRAQSWVQEVAHSIPKHVEGEDHDTDGQAGKNGEIRSSLQAASALATQHAPPGRGRRRGPETQKAQGSFNHNGIAQPDRGNDENRGKNIGQNMPQQNAPGRGTSGACGIDVGIV